MQYFAEIKKFVKRNSESIEKINLKDQQIINKNIGSKEYLLGRANPSQQIINEFVGRSEIARLSAMENQYMLSPGYQYDDADVNRIMNLRIEELRNMGVALPNIAITPAVSANINADEVLTMYFNDAINSLDDNLQNNPQLANQAERIMIPLNLHGNHWVGLDIRIENQQAEITVMDSLNSDPKNVSPELKNVITRLREMLEARGIKPGMTVNQNVAQQRPGTQDCGPYMGEQLYEYLRCSC